MREIFMRGLRESHGCKYFSPRTNLYLIYMYQSPDSRHLRSRKLLATKQSICKSQNKVVANKNGFEDFVMQYYIQQHYCSLGIKFENVKSVRGEERLLPLIIFMNGVLFIIYKIERNYFDSPSRKTDSSTFQEIYVSLFQVDLWDHKIQRIIPPNIDDAYCSRYVE